MPVFESIHINFLTKPVRFFILLAAAFALTACEGYRTATGVVKDAQTDQPLDGVYCKVLTGTQEIYTNKSGVFNLRNKMGACMRNCKDITIEFSKSGYITKTVTNPGADVTIYLDK